MRKYLLLLLLAVTPAFAQYTTVTGTNIKNAAGTPLLSGGICFQPADSKGNPLAFNAGGGDQVTSAAVCRDVTAGVIMATYKGVAAGALALADTLLSNPANVCYQVRVVDNATGQVVIGKPKTQGYDCFQPSGASYDFNAFVPSGISTALSVTGPAGPIGLTGATGATGAPGTASANSGLDMTKTSAPANPGSTILRWWADTTLGYAFIKDSAGNNAAPNGRVQDKGFYNMVTDCGVPSDGTTAIQTAEQACYTAHPGAHFVFPPGSYTRTATVTPRGAGAWVDCGFAGVGGGWVRFNSTAGVTPIVLDNALTQQAKISGCWFVGAEDFASAGSPTTYVLPLGYGGTSDADAVRCFSHGCVLENLTIQSFGRHGINIDTNVYGGNANGFRIYGGRITNVRGACVHIAGGDSNAGIATGIDCTSNQLGGIHDYSFLGNSHRGHHVDLNFVGLTTETSVATISNSVCTTYPYCTMTTAAAHGLVKGDYARLNGTTNANIDGRFTILLVPTTTTFVVYAPRSLNKASGADTGTVFKHASSQKWTFTVPNCSVTAASVTVTCTAASLIPELAMSFAYLPGAGTAGADFVSMMSNGTAPSGTTLQLRDPAVTTVTNVTMTVMVNTAGYIFPGYAQFGGSCSDCYSEANQNGSMFAHPVNVNGGDHGAGFDFYASYAGSNVFRNDANGMHWSGSSFLFDTGNRPSNLTYAFQPGVGWGTTFFYRRNDGTVASPLNAYRWDWNNTSMALTDQNNSGRNIFFNAATATGLYCTTAGCEARVGSDSVSASTSFRSTNTVVGSVSSGGVAKFKGFSLLNLFASDTAPTVSSGFGTSPSIVSNNGSIALVINVGTGGSATSGVIGLPAATTGWNCYANNITAAAAHRADNTRQTASTTTSATIENQTTSTGAALAWTASDLIRVSCFAY